MKLRRLADILTIATCAAVLGLTLDRLVQAHRPSSPQLAARAGYRQGERLPNIPGLDYAATKRTLLLVVSRSCRYCADSLPFYRRLIAAAHRSGHDERIVAVFLDATGVEAADYARRNALDVADVLSTTRSTLSVRGTPTLLLVDERGVVIRVWLGRLSEAAETELLQYLTPAAELRR